MDFLRADTDFFPSALADDRYGLPQFHKNYTMIANVTSLNLKRKGTFIEI